MNFLILKLPANIQTMKRRLEQFWEKFIFIASLIGLVFLFAISFFRYYYLIPRQEKVSEDYSYIQKLENENRELKAAIRTLKKNSENE